MKESKVLEYINSVTEFGTAELQKKFDIGYSDAVAVIDKFEAQGVIGKVNDSKPPLYRSKETILSKIEKYKGKVLPITGRPGIGQEAISLQIALKYHELTNKSVLIINPIQAKTDIHMKLVALRNGFNYVFAKYGYLRKEVNEQFNGLVRGMNFSEPFVDDVESLSEDYIYSQISEKRDIGMLIILDFDFVADKVSVPFLDGIAQEFDIPIIVSALVSRAVDNRGDCRPHRQDIKSSDLNAKDTVLLVFREGYYDLDGTNYLAELIIDECGEINRLPLRYSPRLMKFYAIRK